MLTMFFSQYMISLITLAMAIFNAQRSWPLRPTSDLAKCKFYPLYSIYD